MTRQLDEILREIEEGAEKATPEPWRADATDPDDVVIWGPRQPGDEERSTFLGNVGSSKITELGVAFDIDAKNAEFIADARTRIPRLVRALRFNLEYLRDFVKDEVLDAVEQRIARILDGEEP